ncbi:MAG: glutathione S-transferase C-terminal domain-containing protein [Myxococcota bacterium]
MLVDGRWTQDWHPYQSKDGEGRFLRQRSSFRERVGSPQHPAEPGRYRLYVALICPWASRTLMVRALKGLRALVPITVVEPFLTSEGWRFGAFPGASGDDPERGARAMHELYTYADPHYTGRATVPVLWDSAEQTIVNNESVDIVRMLNSAFDDVGANADVDLYPRHLRDAIDRLAERMYRRLNNGVYRAGFASTQSAYDEAVRDVFAELDALDTQLSDGRSFLLGDALTELDVRAFVSLVRLDVAYFGLFKCNLRPLASYLHLATYCERILAIEGIRETVNLEHIKRGYYSIEALNPSGIVPVGPLREAS